VKEGQAQVPFTTRRILGNNIQAGAREERTQLTNTKSGPLGVISDFHKAFAGGPTVAACVFSQ